MIIKIGEKDISDLPIALKTLKINSQNLKNICSKSSAILSSTPKSMCRSVYTACFNDKPPENTLLSQLETCICISISPEELLLQYLPSNGLGANEKKVKYLVLDCRNINDYNTGHLAASLHIDLGVVEGDLEKIINILTPLRLFLLLFF